MIVRLATAEDFAQVGRLLHILAGPNFAARFPRRSVEDFCRWKYLENPVGEALVGVALDGPQVVSLVAGVPKRIQVGDCEVLAFELGDFITASDYRKRGLFSALIQLVCEKAEERNAHYAYVRPNEQSFPILSEKLSFYEAAGFDERRYVVPSDVFRRKLGLPQPVTKTLAVDWLAEKLFVPPSSSSSVVVESVARFSEDINALWRRAKERYEFCLVRDAAYLNWRYSDCPTLFEMRVARRDGDVAGYSVSLVNEKESLGYLVDLFTMPDDTTAANALLSVTMKSLLAVGVEAIYTWSLRGVERSALQGALPKAFPFVQGIPLHFAVRGLSESGRAAHLGQIHPSRWHVSMGDLDGI